MNKIIFIVFSFFLLKIFKELKLTTCKNETKTKCSLERQLKQWNNEQFPKNMWRKLNTIFNLPIFSHSWNVKFKVKLGKIRAISKWK